MRIPQGARVILLTGAANATRSSLTHPTSSASTAGPIRHLAFGHGAHSVWAPHLARIELLAVLRRLARHPTYALSALPAPTMKLATISASTSSRRNSPSGDGG